VTPTKPARRAEELPSKRPRGRPRLTSPSPEYVARLEQIVDAAAEVFHQKGYDAGSLDDVAEALDLRKASLYHYVNSKAQLLYHIFDRSLTLGLARLEELAATNADPVERLTAFVSHQVSIVAEERSMFSVFFSARPRLEDEFEKRILELERRYLHHYIDAVKGAMNVGAIPVGNPRYTAQAILGMSSWVYKWFDPNEDDWSDVCRSFVQLILHAQVPISLPSSREILHRKAADSSV
jgi:AcrR family transcriptional regulator